MREIYNKFLFTIMLLAAAMVVPACGSDDDEDDGGGNGGGGGNTPAVKMLPTKIYNTLEMAKITAEFKYDGKNHITEIINTLSTDNASFKSETKAKYTITYTDNLVTKVHMKSEGTGSHQTGVHVLEDTYAVSYSGNKVMIELVSSYNSFETSGKGSALGVITLEVDDNGRVTSRDESWEDGRTSKGFFIYDKNGNLIEDAYTGKNVDGNNYIMGGRYEYDDKNNIFAAINAPYWFGHLPLPLFSYKGVNNEVKNISYNNSSTEANTGTTTYTYNSDGYPISYKNESDMPGAMDSEWFVEYTKVD